VSLTNSILFISISISTPFPFRFPHERRAEVFWSPVYRWVAQTPKSKGALDFVLKKEKKNPIAREYWRQTM
jgi:hypothetical protein